MKSEIQGNDNIKYSLFDNPDFTGNANAVCDYLISGTYDITSGAINVPYSTTMASGDHIHTYSTGAGNISGFTVSSVSAACPCVNVIFNQITPTPSATPTLTPTNTPSNTATNTPTNTPTNTGTPTNTPTNTPSNTATNTGTPTNTPSNTTTNTPSNTATNTPTNTSTPTNTPTATQTNFTPLTLCVDTGGIGWNSDTDACNGFCNTQTVYVPQAGITSFQEAAITYGLPLYVNTTFIPANKFNGNNKWFKSVGGGEVFQVGTDGAMSVFSSCPSPTPTNTSTPTQTPTVSLSSTPATTPTNTPSNSGTPNPTPTPTPITYCYTITSVQSSPGECFDCPGYFASTTDTFIEFFNGCSGTTIAAPFDMNVITHYSDSSTGNTFISGGTVGNVLIATSDIQCEALPACGEVASPTFDFADVIPVSGTISECCT